MALYFDAVPAVLRHCLFERRRTIAAQQKLALNLRQFIEKCLIISFAVVVI